MLDSARNSKFVLQKEKMMRSCVFILIKEENMSFTANLL